MADQVDVELDPIVRSLVVRTIDGDERLVRTLVEAIARGFDTAKVRDFLTVLITKESTDELRRRGLLVATAS